MQLISLATRASLLLAMAAAVATKKSASESGAAIGHGMPSPWLALLTSSWSLAGKPESEKSKGLQSLADNLVQLARSGDLEHPDATMQEAINSIQEIVEDMKEAINASNADAQQTLNTKRAALDQCVVPTTTNVVSPLDPSESDVVACRFAEKDLKDNYTECKRLQERCASTDECCHELLQPHEYCLPGGGNAPQPSTLESQCSGRSKCKLNDLNAMLTYFQGKLKELTDAEDACLASRYGCPDPPRDCTPEETAWSGKNSECDGIQVNFEQEYCNLAVNAEGNWDDYTTCYNQADTNCKDEEGKQQGILPDRQQEWRGVLRIECLLGALEADNITAELERCIDTNYGEEHWGHLTLTYPSEQDDYPSLYLCSQTLQTPGAQHFMNAHYSDVIEMIPVAPDELTTYHCVATIATKHCPRDNGVGGSLLLTQSAHPAKAVVKKLGFHHHTKAKHAGPSGHNSKVAGGSQSQHHAKVAHGHHASKGIHTKA